MNDGDCGFLRLIVKQHGDSCLRLRHLINVHIGEPGMLDATEIRALLRLRTTLEDSSIEAYAAADSLTVIDEPVGDHP